MTHSRSHIQDASPAVTLHRWYEGAAHQEGAGEIRVHHLAPLIKGELLDRFADVDTGVVDEDVQDAAASRYIGSECQHIRFRRQIRYEYFSGGVQRAYS